MTAFVGNTNVVELASLTNSLTSAYINDATVVVTITNLDGEEVAGETWPKTMTYVTASNGTYQALLSSDLDIETQQSYRAVIDVESGDLIAQWSFKFRPKQRTD